MSTELVYRMRTCAAAMIDEAGPDATNMRWQKIYRDAADLLVEASNLLDVPEPLGEPMEVLKAAPATPQKSDRGNMGHRPSDAITPQALPASAAMLLDAAPP